MTHQTQLISQLQQNSDTPPPPPPPLASYNPWKSCMQEISCLPYIQKRQDGQVIKIQNALHASQKSDITFQTNMNLNYHELFKARQNLHEENKSDLSGDLSGLSHHPQYKKLDTRELNIPGHGGLNLSQFQSLAESQSNGGVCGSARVSIGG
ncbi:hypothetical protein FGO68_gene12373 [Halteria grandinella]|uniref:Uncharacterized protein n=1 Tax=Halteria grandinella TaxID=5974 RepID=A0A8J8P827_HALGN|nr:hypothetical protein FGO68_gene12373 [Halteria grandinella]